MRDIEAWLLKQDVYTLPQPVRKRFSRNPYNVTNVMDVWECDLVDFQTLGKYNVTYKYLLTVIDVFSKFLHIVPLRSKTGTAVTTAFRSSKNVRNLYADGRSGCEQIGESVFEQIIPGHAEQGGHSMSSM